MQKVVFLDRDGVINHDHGYTSRPEDFHFIDGVFEACQRFLSQGYQIVIVTNQSGIGRGYYTEAQFHSLTDWMLQKFAQQGIAILDVFYCPHHPVSAQEPYLQRCQCRKPAPGMLLEASDRHEIDLLSSVMVGDSLTDMEAAEGAGIVRRFLVGDKYLNVELPDGVRYASRLNDVKI